MDDTSLHVYLDHFGAEAEMHARRMLRFHRGDIVQYRGDLAHQRHTELPVAWMELVVQPTLQSGGVSNTSIRAVHSSYVFGCRSKRAQARILTRKLQLYMLGTALNHRNMTIGMVQSA